MIKNVGSRSTVNPLYRLQRATQTHYLFQWVSSYVGKFPHFSFFKEENQWEI